jgi:hypothetical protein
VDIPEESLRSLAQFKHAVLRVLNDSLIDAAGEIEPEEDTGDLIVSHAGRQSVIPLYRIRITLAERDDDQDEPWEPTTPRLPTSLW